MGRHNKSMNKTKTGFTVENKPKNLKETTKEKLRSIKKQRKLKLKEKRARLVVRNLPFDVTEDSLRQHFAKYGELTEVILLKKEEKHLLGCGFVQFKFVQKAAKARHYTNGKPFLGRDIIVEFALAKNKFEECAKKNSNNEIQIKEEVDETVIKEEKLLDNIKTEELNNEENEKCSDSESSESESGSGDESELEEKNEEDTDKKDEVIQKTKFCSNDVSEGKTIFIKNVPFMADNNDLKNCLGQFGPIYYALICVDKFTEHPKGTAFVKFRNKEDADKALNAGTELTLMGNILDCHPALGKREIQLKSEDQKNNQPKDSRNLYLIKEGVILAGSKAAEGVSSTDMSKRLQLEQYKTQVLRNLNMFISRERLIIHNLPPSWNDAELRTLFQKHSSKTAVIREAKIMRNLKSVDANGNGISKEFGFVTFTKHEDALNALRALNNNPNIFSTNRRPIVAFSIENKVMLKAKQKRLEKSKQKNPKSKDFTPNEDQKSTKSSNQDSGEIREGTDYSGITGERGFSKMRSLFKLKSQAKLHFENLKKEKKKRKLNKQFLSKNKPSDIKQPKQKVKRKNADIDDFAKMVNKYKSALTSAPAVKKTKWYEEK